MLVNAMSRNELAVLVMDVLVEMFDLERATMSLGSDLYADLDIDSIDEVDLAVRLKQMTGKRLQPEVFKTIRTIGDVVVALADLSPDLPAEQLP